MAFPLSEIELHIDDGILALAEQLLDNNQLLQVSETESGLWIGQVGDQDDQVEVEVLLSGKRVKAHTCECGRSNKKVYCEHVVSLLLDLLQKTKEKAEIPPPSEPISAPKRITIPNLLDLVKPKDLKEFIKQYASEERHFGLLLKAHFAYLLPRSKNNEPIGQVLANTLKAIKRPGKTLNRTDWKMLQKVLKSLLKQAEGSLYKKHYSDVYETAEAVLQQLSPLLLVVEDRKVLIKFILDAIELLKELSKKQLAPELEDEIWNFALTESTKTVYYLYDLWAESIGLTLMFAKNQARNDALLELLDRKLKDRLVQKNERISAGLVNYKIQLFELQHNEAALHRYLRDNISHPEVLKQAILIARQQENWQQLNQLSTYALATQQPDETELIFLQDHLLTAAIHQRDRIAIRELALALFLHTYQLEYFQLLKKDAGKKWPTQRAQVLAQLQQQPFGLDNRKMLAQIYANENMIDDLRLHLFQAQSLDLLQLHDQILFEQNISETGQLYFDIITHYLDNYIGRPAAIKIKESIDHLTQIGQRALAIELVTYIRGKYSERGSLLEELDKV